jgi:predicted nucleotidyltransferase
MLGNWLSEALSSRTKTKVVRLLTSFPTREFTGREIAGIIGVGHRAVDIALGDLVSLDIVTVRRIGRANVYTANGDSQRFQALARLFEEEAKTRDALLSEIRVSIPDVLSCVLFGSVARGEESLDSDVDLLVIADNPKGLAEALENLRSKVAKRFSLHLAPIVLTPAQLREKWKAPYVVSATKDGRLVAGESLEGVRARTR